MTTVYVLKLANGKWYVGRSDNITQRFLQHASGEGSEWTKIHRPVDVAYTYPDSSSFDEDKYTKELMAEYGIDNVRGGAYCKVNLDQATRQFITREIRGASDSCFKCGDDGHFIKDCPVGVALPTPSVLPSKCPLEDEHAEDDESADSSDYSASTCTSISDVADVDDVSEESSHQDVPPVHIDKKRRFNLRSRCERCCRTGHSAHNCFEKRDAYGFMLKKRY